MSKFEEGQVIADRYAIKKLLGRGGMGEVYLALDAFTSQDVALKTLHPKYVNNKHAMARFVREVNAAHKLNHPGVVKIYDARQWEDTLFYTMEYVEGKSLRHWLSQRGKLSLASAVRVLCLVADALAHAHEITIHRDLSPENIMVLRDGSIRVLDFGLAKMDDKFKDLTMLGMNLGKLAYIAPEQQVDASRVDHRADIFPLGVIFFEMLTGQRPKPGQKITDFCPELPPEADTFLEKAMAADPDKRFPSAYAFRAELLALYEHSRSYENKVQAQALSAGFFIRVMTFLQGMSRRNGHRSGLTRFSRLSSLFNSFGRR